MDPDPYSPDSIPSDLGGLMAEGWPMLLWLAVLMLGSALAAATEVAFFTLSPTEVQEFKQKGGFVWRLLQKPQRLLATILLFGTFVNIAIIFIVVMGCERVWAISAWADAPWLPWIKYPLAVGLAVFLLLFFGEVSPKIYASQRRLQLVRVLTVPVTFLYYLFMPITYLLVSTSTFWEKRIKTTGLVASHEDIKHAIDLTSEEESPEEEKEILKGIVDFGNTFVKSVMRSRVDMVAADAHLGLEHVVDLINKEGYSRMPVYEDNLDNIIGILYAKDLIPLLNGKSGEAWRDLVRPAYFIPETKKLDALLEDFKTRRLHIAIVVDEFGGTAGLVTLENIIEEIFGDMVDEFDEEEVVFAALGENSYALDGGIHLDDLIAQLELPEDTFDAVRGTADTLAGLILELHRKIPEAGEQVQHEQFHFTVEQVQLNRIRRVRLDIVVPTEAVVEESESE